MRIVTRDITEAARLVLEAYGRNSGNPFDCHYDPDAAVQWMADALAEVFSED